MATVGLESNSNLSRPLWLLAELTYRCPLQCPYCSNPVEMAKYKNELTTEDWIRVMQQARKMGATQLGFSGGEPLVRKDLEDLIKEARRDVQHGLDITLDYYKTRDEQEHALDILQFKLDILWTMLDCMWMAYIEKKPPFYNCK